MSRLRRAGLLDLRRRCSERRFFAAFVLRVVFRALAISRFLLPTGFNATASRPAVHMPTVVTVPSTWGSQWRAAGRVRRGAVPVAASRVWIFTSTMKSSSTERGLRLTFVQLVDLDVVWPLRPVRLLVTKRI